MCRTEHYSRFILTIVNYAIQYPETLPSSMEGNLLIPVDYEVETPGCKKYIYIQKVYHINLIKKWILFPTVGGTVYTTEKDPEEDCPVVRGMKNISILTALSKTPRLVCRT